MNVFVLISGYFGIRLRTKSVANFLWQIVFWRALAIGTIFALYSALPSEKSSFLPFAPLSVASIDFSFGGWFIGAYLGLMLIAPILNTYTEATSTKKLGLYALSFFVLESIFDWLVPSLTLWQGGYTPFAFIGLYLTGRYLAREDAIDLPKRVSGALFTFIAFAAGSALGAMYIWGDALPILRNRLMTTGWGYTSPTTLACSVLLILFFKKVRLSSRIINWLAASSFGAYLFHGGLPFFKRTAAQIFNSTSGIVCIGGLIVFILATYLAATIIDQMRIWVWKRVEHLV